MRQWSESVTYSLAFFAASSKPEQGVLSQLNCFPMSFGCSPYPSRAIIGVLLDSAFFDFGLLNWAPPFQCLRSTPELSFLRFTGDVSKVNVFIAHCRVVTYYLLVRLGYSRYDKP